MNARTRRVAASCAQLSRWLPAASCPAASCADGFFCLASVLQTLAAYRAQAAAPDSHSGAHKTMDVVFDQFQYA